MAASACSVKGGGLELNDSSADNLADNDEGVTEMPCREQSSSILVNTARAENSINFSDSLLPRTRAVLEPRAILKVRFHAMQTYNY